MQRGGEGTREGATRSVDNDGRGRIIIVVRVRRLRDVGIWRCRNRIPTSDSVVISCVLRL